MKQIIIVKGYWVAADCDVTPAGSNEYYVNVAGFGCVKRIECVGYISAIDLAKCLDW